MISSDVWFRRAKSNARATNLKQQKTLEGDYRTEHLFELKQSLEAFDHYQKQIVECNHQIAQHIRSLETKAEPSRSLKAARRVNQKRRNQMEFNVEKKRFESAAWI